MEEREEIETLYGEEEFIPWEKIDGTQQQKQTRPKTEQGSRAADAVVCSRRRVFKRNRKPIKPHRCSRQS
jgi:hypothetical protein